MKLIRSNVFPLLLLLSALVAVYTSSKVATLARAPVNEGISHVMPGEINVLLMAGDRYLAANLLVFRSIVSIGEGSVHFQDKAQIQIQAAVLNARHEDNYYQAAASLPWNGFVEPAQYILANAREARTLDPWPSFFEGFNEYYFNKNNLRAAEIILVSAKRSTGNDRLLFNDLAAKWVSAGVNYQLALGMVEELQKNTKSAVTKKRLANRVMRLKNLLYLQAAVDSFLQRSNQPAVTLDDLVNSGDIPNIPSDPWGKIYTVSNGIVVVEVE